MVILRPRRQLTLEVAADFGGLGALRDQLGRWLEETEVTPTASADLLLVATELCTNAIEATPPDVPVEVRVSNDGTALRLTVANHRPVDSVEVEPDVLQPGSLQERGRGLAIVRSLVDTFVMTSDDDRTVVRAMRLL
ncbi:MAG: ATP-binding protein [Acidimicrobiales bacterium]|jgi:anti-sigma regulatory factor (Ser/Thr protein kinase)